MFDPFKFLIAIIKRLKVVAILFYVVTLLVAIGITLIIIH